MIARDAGEIRAVPKGMICSVFSFFQTESGETDSIIVPCTLTYVSCVRNGKVFCHLLDVYRQAPEDWKGNLFIVGGVK